MLSRCHSVPLRAGLIAAVMAATSASAIPAAAAGPPVGGGCHMVTSPSSTFHMMAGSGHGVGGDNMAAMLSRFSPEPFCGL